MKKKALICILAGILLIATGYILYSSKTGNINVTNSNSELTRDEAVSIMNNVIKDVIKVYENPSEIFDTVLEEVDGKSLYKINNYSDVVDKLFTEKGRKQLENTVFSTGEFFTKNEEIIYFMKDIPIDNQYSTSKITIDNVSIKEDKLSCEVTLSNYVVDSEDVISYYVIVKSLTIIKVEDNWLIDEFKYNNE